MGSFLILLVSLCHSAECRDVAFECMREGKIKRSKASYDNYDVETKNIKRECLTKVKVINE
jgi:hypothetical protein